MEKTTQIKSEKLEYLTLENRKKLSLTGINEVISSSDKELIVKLGDTKLSISGDNISIIKLNAESGELEASGEFAEFNYGKKIGFLKRIFKWNYLMYCN